MSDLDRDTALEEYRQLWSYYCRTLDTRSMIVENYRIWIALPAIYLSFSYFTHYPSGHPSGHEIPGFDELKLGDFLISVDPMISILALCFLSILGLLSTYFFIMENVNSIAYLKAMNDSRAYFKGTFPSPNTVKPFTIDVHRMEISTSDAMPYARCAPLMAANAAIISVVAAMLLTTVGNDPSYPSTHVTVFGFLLIVAIGFAFQHFVFGLTAHIQAPKLFREIWWLGCHGFVRD